MQVSHPAFALPAALLLLGGTLSGHAQSPDAPAPAASSQSEGGLDEIVVTAQRRSENLEKVAVSVSAFGSSQRAERALVTQADLQVSVPGLQVRATSNSNDLNFALRGQSVDAYGGSQPAVVTYVNDVQSVRNSAISLFDLDSVQVLKGPQGTLFGRNATGGSVLSPSESHCSGFHLRIELHAGDFGLRDVDGEAGGRGAGAFAYTNSRYSKPDVTLFGQTLAFGPYADTPKYSGSIFGQVTLPVPRDLGSVSLRADVFAPSYDYFSNLNNSVDPGTRLPGYGLVNLRLVWRDVGTKGFTVAAFAKNVTNKGYYVGGFPVRSNLGPRRGFPVRHACTGSN